MKKILDGYQKLLRWLMVAAVAILMVPITMQVISRYTALIPPYIWTEELSRFVFIWMVMLGAMIAVRDGTHFDVDVWPTLKPRPNAMLRIGRTADDLHLHRMATGRCDLGAVPGRTVSR